MCKPYHRWLSDCDPIQTSLRVRPHIAALPKPGFLATLCQPNCTAAAAHSPETSYNL